MIDYFCSPTEVGQRWVMLYRNVPTEMEQKVVTVREISGDRVHFTYMEEIGPNMSAEGWGWLTQSEFFSRRIEGACVAYDT